MALKDAKAAKSLLAACKSYIKSGPKRPAEETGSATSTKRSRMEKDPAGMSAEEQEESLRLPVSADEAKIAETIVLTNRAPVVLAFAVELIRYTMPEQPLSSRLSLAQAVVSANSRSKAVSLGLEKGPPAEEGSWGEGQPTVTVLRRQVSVLKRSGYEWKGDEEVKDREGGGGAAPAATTHQHQAFSWSFSSTLYFKSSTFVAHVTTIEHPSERARLIDSLMDAKPHLKTATHNAWGLRVRKPIIGVTSAESTIEDSFDDGETMCGAFVQRIMREAGAVDILVVVSRWFGGILLGPDRWRLIRNCVTQALAGRLRLPGSEVSLGGEALWALDLEAMRSKATGGLSHDTSYNQPVVGAVVHRPESARAYLLRSFATAPVDVPKAEAGAGSPTRGKASAKSLSQALEAQKEENLSLLLGAIRLLYDSWADHLTPAELDKKAWDWYVAVRPDVESGPAGWGAKGPVLLQSILDLRRKE